uniref:Uncharacterized protein n=1 Tax=Arion vulgaris TaxID=1028688 RepID=A0A0B6ZJR1_9EUPU
MAKWTSILAVACIFLLASSLAAPKQKTKYADSEENSSVVKDEEHQQIDPPQAPPPTHAKPSDPE